MMVAKRGEYFSLLSYFVVISLWISLQFPTIFADHTSDHQSNHTTVSTNEITIISFRHIEDQCIHKCPDQNRLKLYGKSNSLPSESEISLDDDH
ncbi:hypothetical protein DMENIID0001_093340 [Sergentomyia squamirostris]